MRRRARIRRVVVVDGVDRDPVERAVRDPRYLDHVPDAVRLLDRDRGVRLERIASCRRGELRPGGDHSRAGSLRADHGGRLRCGDPRDADEFGDIVERDSLGGRRVICAV